MLFKNDQTESEYNSVINRSLRSPYHVALTYVQIHIIEKENEISAVTFRILHGERKNVNWT